jgi:hypothetical protein
MSGCRQMASRRNCSRHPAQDGATTDGRTLQAIRCETSANACSPQCDPPCFSVPLCGGRRDGCSRDSGSVLGQLIVSLPIGVGHAYIMLAMQQDAAFIALSALRV